MRARPRPRSRRAAVVAAGVTVAAAVTLAGCGRDTGRVEDAGPAPTRPASPGTAAAGTEPVTLFLVDGAGLVAPVTRAVPAVDAIGAATVEALLEGPSAADTRAGLTTAIPAGTRLLGLALAGGTATVDLSADFEAGGGSAGMLARLAQVVCTLDRFPTVDRVRLELEGRPVDVFSGEGIVLGEAVTCADYDAIVAS